MKLFVYTLAIIGILVSTTLAAPWVVLDSRNDMLAMSSEVYDTVVPAYAVALPPTPKEAPKQIVEEPIPTTTVPEGAAQLNNDVAVTTEELPQADPEPDSELNYRDLKHLEGEEQDDVQTTVKSVPEDDDVQQDLPEVTTMATPSSPSSSAAVDSLIQQVDIIPSEDMMEIKLVPETSNVHSRQNPNSIEEDEPVAAVIVVNKKKHELFTKKSKFQMK